jgi:hypothetical protein
VGTGVLLGGYAFYLASVLPADCRESDVEVWTVHEQTVMHASAAFSYPHLSWGWTVERLSSLQSADSPRVLGF